MFEVYVDKPLPSPAKAPPKHEPRLTNLAISYGAKEATLSPRLNFESFAGVKAQIEVLVPSLAGFEEEAGWLVFSLQSCDERGRLGALLPSTYDSADFCAPRLPTGQKVYLRATVAPNPSAPGMGRATSGAPPRLALGRRDGNTLPAAPARGAREGGAARKATPARKATAPAAKHAATPTPAKTARPPPPVTSQRKKTAAITSTPRQQLLVHSSNSSCSIRSSSRDRAPAFVFKARAAGGSGSDPSSNRETCSKPPLPRRRQHAPVAVTVTTGRREKPGWNSGNEPAWEEVRKPACYYSQLLRPRKAIYRSPSTVVRYRVRLPLGYQVRGRTPFVAEIAGYMLPRARVDCRANAARAGRSCVILTSAESSSRGRGGAMLHTDSTCTRTVESRARCNSL